MTKFPSFSQWKQIFKVLKRGEKIALLIFSLLSFCSLLFLTVSFYFKHTQVVPAFGGVYTEGIVGQPRFINPIYGQINDVDRALTDLIFSGIMTYDKNGEIVNDLAEKYEISPDGKIYTFYLKDKIFWHDQRPLTSDDIIFTIKIIQNSDYKSPLRANWVDVNVEKISDRAFKFILTQPYNAFLENCTVKILPKHIWENISPENFTLSLYNLQPIGSGPFKVIGIGQSKTGFIESLKLESNRRYYNNPSYLLAVHFNFFENVENLIQAIKAGKIEGFALPATAKADWDIEKEIKQELVKKNNFSVYSLSLPRYFAVFFNNQKGSIFADVNIRKAMSYAVNKNELVEKIQQKTSSKINIVDSPILPDFFNYQKPIKNYVFDQETASALLDKAGFKKTEQGFREKVNAKKPSFQFVNYLKFGSKGNEVIQLQECLARLSEDFKEILKSETNGNYNKATEETVYAFQKKYLPHLNPTGETGSATRAKLNELCLPTLENNQKLSFTLTTINQSQLLETANLLKTYWENIGIQVTIKAVNITDIKSIIKDRAYDALLYGETLGMKPDLYPFWYSSQKQDPGLNLSLYENKDADRIITQARQTLNQEEKEQKLQELQNIIINEAPALFLYNSDYLYWISQKVKGVDTTKISDPAKRFVNITNWFVENKRIWKK